MPEDTYGSGGGAQGGASNLAGDQGAAPVGAAPENSTSGALNPFAGQSGAGNLNMISSSNFGAGGGDIVLNNGEKKNSKKWIGIVLVIAVVLLGVGIVVSLVGRREGAQKSEIEKYVNYVVNGDTGDSEIGEQYSKARRYYFLEMFYNASEEDFEKYCDKVQDLLSKVETVSGSGLEALVIEQGEILKMLKVYRELEKYSEDELEQIYIDGDYLGVESVIKEKLESLDGASSGYIKQYVNSMNEFVDSVERKMNAYYEVGCVGETMSDLVECVLRMENEARLGEFNVEPVSADDDAEYVVGVVLQYYLREVYEMNEYDGSNNMEVIKDVEEE